MDTDSAEEIFCLACGYNLRALTTPRCPECGLAFDPAAPVTSRIPWVHRRDLGRPRAFWRTTLLILRHPGTVGAEVARPLAWDDANQFRWLTIFLLALLAAALCAVLYPWLKLDALAVNPQEAVYAPFGGLPGTPRGWGAAVWSWPAAALLTGPGLIAVVSVGLFVGLSLVTWWVRTWFWILGGPLRQRTTALACYATAWWGPAVLWLAVVAGVWVLHTYWNIFDAIEATARSPIVVHAAEIVLALAASLPLAVCWLGILAILHRATRCGSMALALAGAAIALGSAAFLALGLLLAAYALGLLALMAASLT